MSEKSIFSVLLVKKLLFQSDIYELVLLSLVMTNIYTFGNQKSGGAIIRAGTIIGTNTVNVKLVFFQ